MKFADVFNEDVHTDKSHVADARRSWDELMQQVKKFLSKKDLIEFDHFEKSYDDLFGPLTLGNFKIKLLGEEYRVNFERREGPTKGKMRTYKNMHTHEIENFDIVLFQRFENDLDLIAYKDFETQMKDTFRSTFIHEYTHIVDALRSNDLPRYNATKVSQTKAGEYINTAHEFNAFYSQVVDDAEEVFSMRDPSDMFKRSPDFKTFLGLLRIESDAATVLDSEANGKFRKAFIRRVYQLYQDYKNEMLD